LSGLPLHSILLPLLFCLLLLVLSHGAWGAVLARGTHLNCFVSHASNRVIFSNAPEER